MVTVLAHLPAEFQQGDPKGDPILTVQYWVGTHSPADLSGIAWKDYDIGRTAISWRLCSGLQYITVEGFTHHEEFVVRIQLLLLVASVTCS